MILLPPPQQQSPIDILEAALLVGMFLIGALIGALLW